MPALRIWKCVFENAYLKNVYLKMCIWKCVFENAYEMLHPVQKKIVQNIEEINKATTKDAEQIFFISCFFIPSSKQKKVNVSK